MSLPPDVAESNVVLLLFAKSKKPTEVWQALFKDLHQNLKPQLQRSHQDLFPRPSFLDNDNGRVASLHLLLNSPPILRNLKSLTDTSLAPFQQTHDVELILQPTPLFLAHNLPGLCVFDMDSTLIQQEVIDELARVVGVYDKVSAITEAAMRGEEPYTDFEASLRARVGYLKGVPTGIWQEMKTSGIITFTPGARELTKVLKGLGWKMAVLSGGFTPLAEWVKGELGLDYCFANNLVADEARQILTGELVEGKPIIHGLKKQALLKEIAEKEGIPLERVVAVGDGSNDLPMMEVAGLGLAVNAKPKVQKAAPARLNTNSLRDVLFVLGYRDEEIAKFI
ncbi:hypothetical protein DOTSEDRAFT_57284 [Dothistroma septosporum NZE10]|uniref:phosphoserine phosphatase n=1 Tax=Dothistroma septosporum (strain NZE10 / CBS 128990) TaxID=675120 RepID=M2Y102_DOTSN|nr:hypothetical protein DOTSEDRAFT_57284 [Dothistroma septosporum NZE10]